MLRWQPLGAGAPAALAIAPNNPPLGVMRAVGLSRARWPPALVS